MGALKSAVRAFEDDEVQELAMGAVEVLPDLFQTRAGMDMEAVEEYSRAMMRGGYHLFPPLLVYRLPDGRLVLVDGFHRWKAREKQCKGLGCKRTVRAVVREGMMEQAILAGLAANQEDKNALKLRKEDREHAVKLMIRDPELRTWSDSEISRRSGVSRGYIQQIRVKLSREEELPIPDQVKRFSQEGHPIGSYSPYMVKNNNSSILTYRNSRGKTQFRCRVNGKMVGVGTDEEEARRRVSEMTSAIERSRTNLGSNQNFVDWLQARKIYAESYRNQSNQCPGGVVISSGILLLPFPDSSEDVICRKAGLGMVILKGDPQIMRLILVGYRDRITNLTSTFIRLAALNPLPVEFMTPEEVVAEFGPKAEGGTQP